MASLGIGVVLCAVMAHAQTPAIPQGAARPGDPLPRPQLPVRDNSATPTPAGTARIRGRVISAETGAPLRRATVRVSSGELRVNRSVNTDAEGRFEVADLAAGRYGVFVTRNGYVSLQFGQRRPFESGRPLEVGDAQTIDKIDFALPRGGVIAGRITDELGEPLAGIRLQAMRHGYTSTGQRQLMPTGTGFFSIVTNDLGEFRLYGLMPGAYVVSATPSDAMVVMPGTQPASTEFEGHGVTYFPGTINPDEAQPVTVGLAEEAAASFAMVTARMTKISGVVRTSTGKPLTNVMLMLRTRSGGGAMTRTIPGMAVDGTFSMANVPPGDHWLEVVPRGTGEEFASVPITADGHDITDMVITTSPGATISGQVVLDGNTSATVTKSIRIIATPAEPFGPSPMRMGDNTQGVVEDDGRFELRGVSGRILLAFTGMGFGPPPIGWSVKSVSFNGNDVTDIPIDIAAVGSIGGVQIVLTDKQTTLSGTVRSTTGAPVTDYTVVIFPDRRREGAATTRYNRVVRPDQQGRFEIKGLPPGDYLAAAVESLEQGGQFDPAFRKQIEPTAKRFSLTEGQSSILDLTLTQ
jgi:hypothetical protein